MDIQAAFVTISPEKNKKSALKEHGINPLVTEWYYNYITNRHLYLEINKCTSSSMVGTGFPQGGVCSVKFWIIAYNQAIKILKYLVRVAPDCNLSYWEDRNGDSTWAVLFSGGCRP